VQAVNTNHNETAQLKEELGFQIVTEQFENLNDHLQVNL
jgi:hypothetical protein